MDSDAVVTEQTESGKRLIEALGTAGFEVRAAFWAKPTEEGTWYLYLVSPAVDEKGPAAAYSSVFDVMRQLSGLWIGPLEIKVLGLEDSLAQAAIAKMMPKARGNPFAGQNGNPNPGMTRFGGSILGGVSIDGAYIYPLVQPAA